MRVALITHQFPSREHPYISDWAAALQQAGVELLVLAESRSNEKNNTAIGNLRIGYFNPVKKSEFHQPGNFLRISSVFFSPARWMHALQTLKSVEQKPRTRIRKLYEYFPWLNERVDLVHFNAPQLAVRRFELGKLFDAPVIVSFRGQDMTFHPQRYDQILEQADHLHFISNHLVEEARRRGYPGGKHTLIPPAIDTTFYSPSSSLLQSGDRSVFRIFTAARLEWIKGFDYAIHSMALLIHKGWNLQYFIAGDGPMHDAILYATRQLGIEDRVHFLGWQSPEAVRDQMQSADLYLLTSVGEGFNNSVVQAQACGLPVVCSDVGGLPENIQDGVTGLLAQNRNSWDVAEKMERLLQDTPTRRRMAINARQHAVEHFDLSKNINQFICMYRSVLHI
jgi:glycosyltransferase involved in cell wall biosynthesis